MVDTRWIIALDDTSLALENAGGKGANLGIMAGAGLPVPGGFVIGTDAYRTYVTHNGLHEVIALAGERVGERTADVDALDAASEQIRAAFTAGKMPKALGAEILAAYAAIGSPAVAVRSSATAEDLPDLSFAGQQDTFLNVHKAGLLSAVVDCWSSLWTARAIGYRARNLKSAGDIALAVVVQEMVESEASGVLFTANPLTGMRAESVVDAIFGLGEALVSGQVEPDHYVVANQTGEIRTRTLGHKALVIRGLADGGTESVDMGETQAASSALPDVVVQELVAIGQQVQRLYRGAPQDIEWARRKGRFYLLQSRAITSLFPIPDDARAAPPSVMFSFAAVQGMLDPLTPIGTDALKHLGASFAREFGYDMQAGEVPATKFAGMRMWLDITPALGNQMGRRMISAALSNVVSPGAARTALSVSEVSEGGAFEKLPSRKSLARLRGFFFPVLRRVAMVMRDPDGCRAETMAQIDATIARCAEQAKSQRALGERVRFVETLLGGFLSELKNSLISTVMVGVGSTFAFALLAKQAGIEQNDAFRITRGLSYNVTSEMDLALWQLAQRIRSDAESAALFGNASGATLAERYLQGTLPQVAQQSVADFLARYGMRGVAEIDFGRKRWREEPTQVMQMVQNYLAITNPDQAPDVQHRRGALEAQATIDTVVAAIRTKLGDVPAGIATKLAVRVRALAGLRELPKFTVIRVMGIAREVMDAAYADLAQRGVLGEAGDGVFLTFDELRAIDAGYQIDWQALVDERKQIRAREMARRQVPEILLGDGRAFYTFEDDTETADGQRIRGTPVSAGVAEGVAHVVFDPHKAALAHGEILVCPGTDPAWTPLFLNAGGLVMEVGGMMTHGSVVAREYGIPAVVGVREATTRIPNGTRIRVNGSTGEVTILDDEMVAD